MADQILDTFKRLHSVLGLSILGQVFQMTWLRDTLKHNHRNLKLIVTLLHFYVLGLFTFTSALSA